MAKSDGKFDVNKFVVDSLKTSNENMLQLWNLGCNKLKESCAFYHPPGTQIKYDLAYFFRWYGIAGTIPQTLVYNAIVIDCIHIDGACDVLIIGVILPDYVEFTLGAYELSRCIRKDDGSWLLYVSHDPKLMII